MGVVGGLCGSLHLSKLGTFSFFPMLPICAGTSFAWVPAGCRFWTVSRGQRGSRGLIPQPQTQWGWENGENESPGSRAGGPALLHVLVHLEMAAKAVF